MEIAIVDNLSSDALSLRQILTDVLKDIHLLEDIVLFSDGEALLDAYTPGRFSVIFLDILMGNEHQNGLDIARRLREKDDDVCLVFTTIEKFFALDGYTVRAMDYLVKPVVREQVMSVIQRVHKHTGLETYIELREDRHIRKIPVNAILYMASVHRIVEVHTEQGISTTYMTLAELFGQLQDSSRFRYCCRGIIVNLDKVKDIVDTDFILSNGEQLPISRSKRGEMLEAFTDHLFTQAREAYFNVTVD